MAVEPRGRGVAGVVAAWAIAGCWKSDYAELPAEAFPFEPEAGAPPGWSVAPLDPGLVCPDEEPAPMYLLYPDSAAREGADPVPVVLLFGSGAFDFVYAPDPVAPLAGSHFADPSRLTAAFGVEQVFVTLGMAPEIVAGERHDGRLSAALAERGYAVLLPSNCWGDLWAGDRALHPNDFAADFFSRDGRSAASWAWGIASDPAFAEAFDVTLPVALDATALVAIGLGEGGRAVVELVSAGHPLAGALLDSPPDDLRLYFEDPALYASTVEGLTRIFPEGVVGTEAGSAWAAGAALPAATGLVWSSADPVLPVGIFDAALAALPATAWVEARTEAEHVLINGAVDDPALVRAALDAVL